MWERSAPSTLFQEAVGRAGQLHRPELSMASPSPRPCFTSDRTYSLDCRISKPMRMSASIQLRFHSPEQPGSKGTSRRLASSPVPKNDKEDCAGGNASSNLSSSRLASVHPACQHRVAPRLNASSRKRAPYPASYCSATWTGSAVVSFSGSGMEITWSALEQTAAAFLILIRFMFAYTGEHEPEPVCRHLYRFRPHRHEVEVWASTVYEAVREDMREFRAGGITRDLPGLNTELSIAVHRQPVTHKLQLRQVTQWASGGARARGT